MKDQIGELLIGENGTLSLEIYELEINGKKIDIKEKSVMIFGDKKEDLDILEYGRKFIVKDTIYLYDGDNDAR